MNMNCDLAWHLLTVGVAMLSPLVMYLAARKHAKTETQKVANDVKKFKLELEDRYRGKLLDEKLSFYRSVGRAAQDVIFGAVELAHVPDEQDLHEDQAPGCLEKMRNLHKAVSQGWLIVPTELLKTTDLLGITIGRVVRFKKKGESKDAIKELEENIPSLMNCFQNTMRKDVGMSEIISESFGAYYLNLIKSNCNLGEKGLQE